MKFKVGDRVQFLNQTGGGRVKRILNSKMVEVETNDGFALPTLVNELILSRRGQESVELSKDKFFEGVLADPKKPKVAEPVYEEEEAYTERIDKISLMKRRNTVPEGLYLAFVPQNQKVFLSGDFDVYFFNHSPHDCLVNIFLQDVASGQFMGKDYDAVPAHSKLLLDSIPVGELEEWSRGMIQVMLHPEKSDELFKPMSVSFGIKGGRFTKQDNYKEYNLLPEVMFLFGLWDAQDFVQMHPEGRKLKISGEESVSGSAVHVKPKPFIARHQTSPSEAVVDLHIEAVAEDYRSMDKGQMLGFQVGYFTKCMESALTNNFRKVTFIHGVGQGVLKNALLEVLKDYDGIQYQDAPMSNFGMGAIEVRFSGK